MESFAFIGTRQPRMLPRPWYQLFTAAAVYAAEHGYVVNSGASQGAEQLAADRALAAGGRVRLYLPWDGYEGEWVQRAAREYPGHVEVSVFGPESHAEWAEAIHAWHPAGSYLARASLALYARSYGAVREASSVVALPFLRVRKGASEKGQTEQGLEIARKLGLPLYDLSVTEDRQRLRDRLGIGSEGA